MPVSRNLIPGIGVVAEKAAARLTKPLCQRAGVVPPQDVVTAVSVIVAGTGDMPAR